MERIGGSKFWSFKDGASVATTMTNQEVRNGKGHLVKTYMELVSKVAELQFRNRDHVLLFRGQSSEHLNRGGNTSLLPSIFHKTQGSATVHGEQLRKRFELLIDAEAELVRNYRNAKHLGMERVTRHRVLRWSILQHYQVCGTPLLDVTHSLRIAASFASLKANDDGYIYVLGVPNLSGSVTASVEAGLQIVRLSSICPPAAMRPHVQQGYLLGEYPEMGDYGQKELYEQSEIDPARRLIAKFRIKPKGFWKNQSNFPKVGIRALFPSVRQDELLKLTKEVKARLT